MRRLMIAVMMLAMLLPMPMPMTEAYAVEDEVLAVIETGNGMENALEIREAPPIESEVEIPEKQAVYKEIQVSDDDRDLLARILWAEANNQGEEGQKAVIEVIFNRVLSDEWPATIYDVLSQRGQFATWKSRNKVKATQLQYDVIDAVLAETETVLPDTSFVYFDRRGKNGKNHIRIQDHVFGR